MLSHGALNTVSGVRITSRTMLRRPTSGNHGVRTKPLTTITLPDKNSPRFGLDLGLGGVSTGFASGCVLLPRFLSMIRHDFCP